MPARRFAGVGRRRVAAAANPLIPRFFHPIFTLLSGSGQDTFAAAGGRSGTATAEEFTVGTLAVDIVDATTKTIVWRAMATRDIDVDANPQKRDKNIARAVATLFKHYPAAN